MRREGEDCVFALSAATRRRAVMTMAAAMVALAVGACGQSSHSGGSGHLDSSQKQSLAEAKKAVQRLQVRPTSMKVPALPSKPAPGKTIDFIACGVPSCQAFIPIVKQAAAQVGWNVKAINSGTSPQTVAAAYDQAVRDKPAGVIGSGGNSPAIFSHELRELKSEGVPVVLQVVPPSTLPGVTAVVYGAKNIAQDGKEMADEILADSGAHDVHLAIAGSPGTPVYLNAHGPLEAAMRSSSCDSCSVQTFSFPETDLGPELPSKIEAYLRSHPNINYLFFDFTDEVAGVPAALKRAGLNVKIVTEDVAPEERPYVQSGQELAAAGTPWPEILWYEVGMILGLSEHQPLATYTKAASRMPQMIVTKRNLPALNSGVYFSLVPSYQSIFKKAWKVQ